jgi:hypothetical protein
MSWSEADIDELHGRPDAHARTKVRTLAVDDTRKRKSDFANSWWGGKYLFSI